MIELQVFSWIGKNCSYGLPALAALLAAFAAQCPSSTWLPSWPLSQGSGLPTCGCLPGSLHSPVASICLAALGQSSWLPLPARQLPSLQTAFLVPATSWQPFPHCVPSFPVASQAGLGFWGTTVMVGFLACQLAMPVSRYNHWEFPSCTSKPCNELIREFKLPSLGRPQWLGYKRFLLN